MTLELEKGNGQFLADVPTLEKVFICLPGWRYKVQRDPGMKIVYQRQIDKGKKKKVAIVVIMRKLLIRANAALRVHIETQEKNLSVRKGEK